MYICVQCVYVCSVYMSVWVWCICVCMGRIGNQEFITVIVIDAIVIVLH